MLLDQLAKLAAERAPLVGQMVDLMLELKDLLHLPFPATLRGHLVLATPPDVLD